MGALPRRGFFSVGICVLLTVAIAAPIQAASEAGGPPDTTRSNILLLVSDDQTFGNFTRDLMPNVFSQLVDRGVLFDRAYVDTGLCCPSRSEILTGLYEHHTRVDDNDVPLLRPTILDALHAQGYRTSLTGKYLNSWPCDPRPEFDQWVCMGEGLSSYSLTNPTLNVNGQWAQYQGYTTDILADFTSDFIDSTPQEQPFFAVYTPTSPHLPANDFRCGSIPVVPPRPPSYDEDTTLDGKPQYLRRPPLSPSEVYWIDQSNIKMTRAVACLDSSIGSILSRLGSRESDTLIFFLSDNGFLYGEHRRWEKSPLYEEVVHVPFVVRYPALVPDPQAFSTSALVENVDIAPTIAAILGMEWGADGLSLLPILDGSVSDVRDAALIQFCQGAHYPCNHPLIPFGGALPPSVNGVVTQTTKYMEYATGEKEMYDLVADPYELQNLAGDPGYADQQADLAAQLASLRAPPQPETTIYAGPEGTIGSRVGTLSFFSQSPLATFQCRLTVDGVPGAWEACDQGSVTLGALGDGDYVFEVYATDEYGAVDPTPASRSFSIHSTGPDARVDSGPPAHNKDGVLSFSFSSQTPGVTFECQLSVLGSAGAWEPCDPSTGITYGPVGEGEWVFQARATDGLGNYSDPPAEWLVHVDTTGPVMSFLQSPLRRVQTTDAFFRFRPDETILGSMNCRLDLGAWVDCSGGTFSVSGLSEGLHKLSVNAKDELGTARTSVIRWTVDHTPPILTMDGPDPYTNATTATLDISANEYLLQPTLTCALDGQNLVDQESLVPGCRKRTVTVNGLADGPHILETAAVDGAENLSSIVSWSWTVDTVAPVTTITSGPVDPTSETSATLEFSASDASPVTFRCRLDQAPAAPCSSPVTYTGLSLGAHHFRAQATDAAGNVGPGVTWSWRIVTLGPARNRAVA
jgi:arylsulfatase A-like enzyme